MINRKNGKWMWSVLILSATALFALSISGIFYFIELAFGPFNQILGIGITVLMFLMVVPFGFCAGFFGSRSWDLNQDKILAKINSIFFHEKWIEYEKIQKNKRQNVKNQLQSLIENLMKNNRRKNQSKNDE